MQPLQHLHKPRERFLQHLQTPSLRKLPSLAIFDWDNTLFDFEGAATNAYLVLIEKIGRKENPPTPDEVRDAWYHKGKDYCQQTCFPGHSIDEIKSIFDTEMKKAPRKLFPDRETVVGLLEAFRAKGIPMAIISNKREATLKDEIEHFGLSKYFTHIRGDRHPGGSKEPRDSMHALKPDTLPILSALRDMRHSLDDVWFIGDSCDDAGATRLGRGIQCFIVGEHNHTPVQKKYGHDHHDDHCRKLDTHGGIIYLDHLSELKNIVESLPSLGYTIGR